MASVQMVIGEVSRFREHALEQVEPEAASQTELAHNAETAIVNVAKIKNNPLTRNGNGLIMLMYQHMRRLCQHKKQRQQN